MQRPIPNTERPVPSLLAGLPGHLSTDLFVGAKPVRLAADEVLFLASDPGDGCYRIDDGLLKVTMVSRSGSERILSFLGRGSIVGELSMIDGLRKQLSSWGGAVKMGVNYGFNKVRFPAPVLVGSRLRCYTELPELTEIGAAIVAYPSCT